MWGCSSETPEELPTGGVELDIKNKEEIRMWCNTRFSFEAIEDGQYSIESQDPSIAEVRVDGKLFTVRTLNPGETNITIENKVGGKSVIKCSSRTFTKVWSEMRDLNKYYKNTVMVAVTDKSVAEEIEKELMAVYLNRDYEYTFTENSDKLSVFRPAQGDPLKGTYSYDIETNTLTLNYGGMTERYFCDLKPPYLHFYTRLPFIMAIRQDLTHKYALKYPDAKVVEVYIIRHIMSLSDYWLTEREGD